MVKMRYLIFFVILMIFLSGCSIFFWKEKISAISTPEEVTVALGDATTFLITINSSKERNRECNMSVVNAEGAYVPPNSILNYSLDPYNLTVAENTSSAFVVILDLRSDQIPPGQYVYTFIMDCRRFNSKWSKIKDEQLFAVNTTLIVEGG